MGIKLITENRKARFDFQILEDFEAGLVLKGSELKSLREGQCQLKDSYISFQGDEAFLQNAHISVYKASSYNNHEPERLRKLLLNRVELDRIYAKMREKGLSCVPLKMYFKKGRVKLLIALAKGKNKGDKRDTIKNRDADKKLRQQLKKSR